MKTQYISLTTAINFWEEYKIDYVRKLIKNPSFVYIEYENSGQPDIASIHMNATDSPEFFERACDLLYHIKRNKINLYGKKKQDTELVKLDEHTVSLIIYENMEVTQLDPYKIGYEFYNSYNYKESYSSSVNYDTLRLVIGDIRYTDLSIEYEELNDYIKALFEDWWKVE